MGPNTEGSLGFSWLNDTLMLWSEEGERSTHFSNVMMSLWPVYCQASLRARSLASELKVRRGQRLLRVTQSPQNTHMRRCNCAFTTWLHTTRTGILIDSFSHVHLLLLLSPNQTPLKLCYLLSFIASNKHKQQFSDTSVSAALAMELMGYQQPTNGLPSKNV